MKPLRLTTNRPYRRRALMFMIGLMFAFALAGAEAMMAQQPQPPQPTATGASPWVNVVNELQTQFTGPIARGLSLVAIVIGGLMFAFGEGGSKRAMAGIIFGLGMAMGAAQFLGWLFP